MGKKPTREALCVPAKNDYRLEEDVRLIGMSLIA
jgi:hypothetical protein